MLTAMEPTKAVVLAEKKCYIGNFNMLYGNESTFRDCIKAGRPLPCSLCGPRTNINIDFPPSPVPPGYPSFPVLIPLANPTPPLIITRSSPPLTRKEQAVALLELTKFGESVRIAQKGKSSHRYAPRTSYLPTATINTVINQFMEITTQDDLQAAIPLWKYHDEHGAHAIALIMSLRIKFNISRQEVRLLQNEKNRATAAAKHAAVAAE